MFNTRCALLDELHNPALTSDFSPLAVRLTVACALTLPYIFTEVITGTRQYGESESAAQNLIDLVLTNTSASARPTDGRDRAPYARGVEERRNPQRTAGQLRHMDEPHAEGSGTDKRGR
jgi:hypothetical protein